MSVVFSRQISLHTPPTLQVTMDLYRVVDPDKLYILKTYFSGQNRPLRVIRGSKFQ
jgi:hypothetical protein